MSSDSPQTRRRFFGGIEGRPCFVAFSVIFRVMLEFAYKDFVVPWYGSSGFPLVDNPAKYIESWALYMGLLLFLPPTVRRPSDLLICLAFFVYIAPLLMYYGFTDASQWALYCVVAQYTIMNLMRWGPPVRVLAFKRGPTIALWLAVVGIVVATSWMIAAAGLTNFNLDLEAVYEFREEAGMAINVGAMSYIVVWATTVCGPLVLMLALRDGHRAAAFGIILLHVVWFGITAHKAVLFFPTLVLFLYALFKRSRALSLMPLGMCLVVLLSLVSYYATDSLLLSGLFVRRVFFIPSYLTFTYFEFFEQNPFVYWSNSFLSVFVNYPYDESVPLVIGSYLNDPTAWANNSFFSTGYMHAGLLGVVIYGMLAGALLKLLDSLVTRTVPLWMSLSVIIVPFFTLFTSADLTTALLTHGLGFAILMLYLMKLPGEVRTKGLNVTANPRSEMHRREDMSVSK